MQKFIISDILINNYKKHKYIIVMAAMKVERYRQKKESFSENVCGLVEINFVYHLGELGKLWF